MAHFQDPNDPEIEAALARLIRSQLAAAGADPDEATLNRVRQQLPVAGWLECIHEVGQRECHGPAMVEIEVVTPEAAAAGLPMTEPPASTGTGGGDSTEAAQAQAATSPAAQAKREQDSPPAVTEATLPAKPEPPVQVYRLLVPNATAEIEYRHQLDLAKEPLSSFRITAISGLEDIGLQFDPDTGLLHGIPRTEPGKSVQHELQVTLEPLEGSNARAEALLSLFINPHPRTLWKQIEPDASLEFRKEHRRSLCDAGPPRVLAASVRGRSHENSGAFREDDFHVGRDDTQEWTVVAVSDGAGSARLSRLGSQIATQACVAILLEALERHAAAIESALSAAATGPASEGYAGRLEEAGRELFLEPVGRAAFEASRAIKAKASELGVEEKALAATLMFAASRRLDDHLLIASYWIGDGAAALLDPAGGQFRLLGEADSGEFSGQTRFLLSAEFPPTDVWESIRKRFRFHCVPLGTVLLLMTDGVSDPKFGTDNALRDPARWLSFWNDDLAAQLSLTEADPGLGARLEEYLQFWSQGEHDDRTLALVYWP